MPHIDQATKTKLETEPARKMGDACYLFSQVALKMYNADPSWTTIHKIRVASRAPYHNADWHAVIHSKMQFLHRLDIEAAADLAFFEFYRLVGSIHEDVKAIENGNAFDGAKTPRPTGIVLTNDMHKEKR